MTGSENVTPINDAAREFLERGQPVAEESLAEILAKIATLGSEALRVMSALTLYWNSQEPTIRDAANVAITQAVEVTLGPPPAPPN